MSEESRKGISLRTKRKGRPAISAPKQISGPVQQTGDVSRNTGGKSSLEAPPQRPQAGGKVYASRQFWEDGCLLGRFIDIRSCQASILIEI